MCKNSEQVLLLFQIYKSVQKSEYKINIYFHVTSIELLLLYSFVVLNISSGKPLLIASIAVTHLMSYIISFICLFVILLVAIALSAVFRITLLKPPWHFQYLVVTRRRISFQMIGEIYWITEFEFKCSGRVSSFCFTGGSVGFLLLQTRW
jgi:hypothetical protein